MNLIDIFFPDHFSQDDRRGVIAGLLLSAIASIALIKATLPVDNRIRKPVARIENFSNNVRYKEAGSVSFFDVSSGEILQNSDEIFTGQDSRAFVRFLKSNTLLKIPSSSLIRIEETDGQETIEIQDGLVDIIVGKNQTISLKAKGVIHQINATQKESAIKAYYNQGELHLYTKDGGVKIKNASGNKELLSNHDGLLKSELKYSSTFKLLSPTPGENLDNGQGIKIRTDKKSKYYITLSKNADFTRPFHSAQLDGTDLLWETSLEEGDYFLQVRDKEDRKIVPVTLSSKYRVDGFSPTNGELLKLNPGDGVTLRWNPVPVKSYKVIVRDNFGKEKIYITRTNQLQLGNVKGSEFEWTVLPEIAVNKYSSIKKSTWAGLRFNGKIEFIDFPQKTKFKTSKEKIQFSWASRKGEQFLVKVLDLKNNRDVFVKELNGTSVSIPIESRGINKIEVSSRDYPSLEKAEFNYEVNSPILRWDPKLKNIISVVDDNPEVPLKYKADPALEANANLLIIYQPLIGKSIEKKMMFNEIDKIKLEGFGQYCFRAQLIRPLDNFDDSENYCLKLVEAAAFPPLPRAMDTVLSYSKHNGIDSYKIEVPSVPNAAAYHLEIYADRLSKKLVYSTKSKSPVFFWATNRSGVFFYKYKVIDAKQRGSDFSQFSKLIFPISPLSDW